MLYPTHAISIRQPYAELILQAKKQVEYRSWHLPQDYINVWLYLHASKTMNTREVMLARKYKLENLPTGCLIGMVRFGNSEFKKTPKDVLDIIDNPMCWHFPVREYKRIEPIPCKGKLRIFRVSLCK